MSGTSQHAFDTTECPSLSMKKINKPFGVACLLILQNFEDRHSFTYPYISSTDIEKPSLSSKNIIHQDMDFNVGALQITCMDLSYLSTNLIIFF